MRNTLNKRSFTKAERIFGRLLQENHIPFKTKVRINRQEIDFLIGKYAVEIDGHEQLTKKNLELVRCGYIPVHFSNREIVKGRKQIKIKLINEFNKI